MDDLTLVKQIDEEISKLERELQDGVEGTSTEVYSRIVGYYRAVGNWNKGKREEFSHRTCFKVEDEAKAPKPQEIEKNSVKENSPFPLPQQKTENVSKYLFFSSQYCRNCQPVKDFLDHYNINYESVDVSTDLGLNVAREYGVKATPTVVMFDDNQVVGKAMSKEELLFFFDNMKIAK